jgi:hypothetical protein
MAEPVPVTLSGPVPVPVEIMSNHDTQRSDRPDILTSTGETVSAPTTTSEQDRHSAGQRDINKIWEDTQKKIALSVIWASLSVSMVLAIGGSFFGTPDVQLAAVVFLFGVANLVTGFYFGRTNHQKVGGVDLGR